MPSRLSTTTACWRCSFRVRSRISREPSRSDSQGEQDNAWATRTASAAKARGGKGARGHTADACLPAQHRHLRDRGCSDLGAGDTRRGPRKYRSECRKRRVEDTGLGIERSDKVVVVQVISRPRKKKEKVAFYQNLCEE